MSRGGQERKKGELWKYIVLSVAGGGSIWMWTGRGGLMGFFIFLLV